MKIDEIIFIDNLPTIDLHGFDCAYARVKINEFINDNKLMKNEFLVIIHGIGSGILKRETHKILQNNKDVLEYKLFYNNVGVTVVRLKIRK